MRKDDNTALLEACKQSDEVLCVFIFTPEQIKENPYKSDNAVQFMCESLIELQKTIPLMMFYGDILAVLNKISKTFNFEAIFVNMDYTPYSTKRDKKIHQWAKKKEIDFLTAEDIMLQPIDAVLTADGNAYQTYGAFRNKSKKMNVRKPVKFPPAWNKKLVANKIKIDKVLTSKDIKKFYKFNSDIHVHGGRKNAMDILNNLKDLKKYDDTRNFPSISTTNLSAYNKFGCVSIREVYHATISALGSGTGLIDQYIWRDFYYNLLYYNPHSQNNSYYPQFDKIKWDDDPKLFKKWTQGETGFPFADAGMRQMNETGYMHNRVRMVVANVLVKHMLINWKKGETYLAQKLVDYDPAQNVGNWQWNASTGVDRFAYGPFRPFNPFQSNKYDKDAEYIKKWVPELEDVPARDIHRWDQVCDKYIEKGIGYPKPIVDYKSNQEEFKKRYLKAKGL